MAKTDTVELVLDAKATLGEGAIWHAQQSVLYWVDILAGKLHAYDPSNGKTRTWDVGQYIGTVVPRRSGGLMLALHHGIARFDPETETLAILCDPESHLAGNRFNDGKCDPAGRFWAGTMATEEEPEAGNLYCLFADHSVKRMLEKVSISNGIVWSLDNRTMYFIDTPKFTVDAFDYRLDTGAISRRRVAITIPKEMGYPDGSTLDAEGMIWIAHYGGSCVTRWDPGTGKLLQTLSLPVSNATSCAFGGPKLDRLYVTSARLGLSETQLAREPIAGGVFCAIPGVRGVEASPFAG